MIRAYGGQVPGHRQGDESESLPGTDLSRARQPCDEIHFFVYGLPLQDRSNHPPPRLAQDVPRRERAAVIHRLLDAPDDPLELVRDL